MNAKQNTKYVKKTPNTPKNTKYAKKYTKYANKTPTTPKKNTKYAKKNTKYSKILQIFIYAVLSRKNFVPNSRTFWCTFYRPKKYGGVPKRTNIRYATTTTTPPPFLPTPNHSLFSPQLRPQSRNHMARRVQQYICLILFNCSNFDHSIAFGSRMILTEGPQQSFGEISM